VADSSDTAQTPDGTPESATLVAILGNQASQGEWPEAARALRLAADKGDLYSQTRYGQALVTGTSVEKNEVEGARYLRLAADRGEAWAQRYLADCFIEGKGVAKNDAEANRYLRHSANQGNPHAAYSLGCRLRDGVGGEKNRKEARHYLAIARQAGFAPLLSLSSLLGLLYVVFVLPFRLFLGIFIPRFRGK
jgi:TPR repeat protein